MRARELLITGVVFLATLAGASMLAPTEAHGESDPTPLESMDIDFLREKLLKIWIIEEASDRHNQRRIAEKSFKGMSPYEPTGDAAIDAENRAAYLKNDKHLRHYLSLELDNAIQVIDICKRVLGRHTKAPETGNAALRELLSTELPEIEWADMPLEDALQELGRRAGVNVEFSGLAANEDARIDVQFPAGFLLQQAIEYIQSIHPMDWVYEGGTLKFTYIG